MKRTVTFVSIFCVAIGIGWYFGSAYQLRQDQRMIVRDYDPLKKQIQADVDFWNTKSSEYFKAAEPWQASSASIALGALDDLSKNDIERAGKRLSAIVAVYYRGHSVDGDTNLLGRIRDCAANNGVLSNAIYGKL